VAQFAVAALFERRNLLHQKAGGPSCVRAGFHRATKDETVSLPGFGMTENAQGDSQTPA